MNSDIIITSLQNLNNICSDLEKLIYIYPGHTDAHDLYNKIIATSQVIKNKYIPN